MDVEVLAEAARGALLLSLTAMIPITLASLGEILTERAGVVNIGLEGIMLSSAWLAVFLYHVGLDPYLAIALGSLAGTAIGVVHAIISVYLKGDQIVAGIGVNIMAAGGTVIATYLVWGNFANSPPVETPGGIELMGVEVSLFFPLTIAIGVGLWLFLEKTDTGLRLKSVGNDPKAAEALGVNVAKYQVIATIVGATLAGLAGAFYSVDYIGSFSKNMTAGRGFIALANVAFSGWNPLGALLGGMVFGYFDAVAQYAKVLLGRTAENYLIQTLPYIATLIAVAFIARRGRMPRWLGRPYFKE
ncbi:MAG: ABC transporter permease [Aeropyrum sp.]|nr:ABC transporter permease [Aeropyrum sp.]